MSMVDEMPSYYIHEGKIYKHHKANHYMSGGFICGEDACEEYLCDATDDTIASYIEEGKCLYDYSKNKYLDQSDIKSICKDNFGNDIYIGSKIVLLDMYSDDSFNKFTTGTVVGETDEHVKIKSDDHNMHKRSVYKTQYREYVNFEVPYILRSKESKRFLLIRKLK